MSPENLTVTQVLSKAKQWQKEVAKLRALCLASGLLEELKWGKACYALEGHGKVVLIHGFKDYCALLFFKGALLKDAKHLLIQQTENVQAARQLRFKNVDEVNQLAATVKSYIREAIGLEKSGAQVVMKATAEFAVPEEFQTRIDSEPAVKRAFEALTPGRQKGYLLYFSAAKQAKTRDARIMKYVPQILRGKGLDDE